MLNVVKYLTPILPVRVTVSITQVREFPRRHLFESRVTNIAARTGYLEVDDEGGFWADHDEDCHGKIDTDEMREEFPDGFRWDCCGQTGDAEGCHRGAHQSDQLVSKDGISANQYESDEEEDDDNEDEDENEEDEEDEAQEEKGEDPEVVIVEERQVVNKRKADDSFEVSVYAQNAKRDRW